MNGVAWQPIINIELIFAAGVATAVKLTSKQAVTLLIFLGIQLVAVAGLQVWIWLTDNPSYMIDYSRELPEKTGVYVVVEEYRKNVDGRRIFHRTSIYQPGTSYEEIIGAFKMNVLDMIRTDRRIDCYTVRFIPYGIAPDKAPTAAEGMLCADKLNAQGNPLPRPWHLRINQLSLDEMKQAGIDAQTISDIIRSGGSHPALQTLYGGHGEYWQELY